VNLLHRAQHLTSEESNEWSPRIWGRKTPKGETITVLFALSVPLVVLDEDFSIDLANRAFRFGHKTRSMPTRYHILALVRLQEVGSKLEARMKVKEASDAGKCELMALDTM